MHQPRPFGLFGAELTTDDSVVVNALARSLTNMKAVGDLASLRVVRALPDGGYAVAQEMGGVFKVIAYKDPPPVAQATTEGLAQSYIPMLFSARVTQHIVRGDAGVGLLLTQQTRRRLTGYGKTEGESPIQAQQYLQRFRIEYSRFFPEFRPSEPGDRLYSQYGQLLPTWYSGAMAQVVQVVGGYGRQDLASLPDTAVERARMLLPQKVKTAIETEIGNTRLPGYLGLPSMEGEQQYYYRSYSTHGVSFDSERKPWLVQVTPSGVHAMPLPMIPATTTRAFRAYVEEMGDDELLAVLDRFGGMPSGEPFPRADDFESWRRAGVVIKVCDTSDFYQHAMYSTACGWSFNSSGTEGFNTCYGYDQARTMNFGLAYKLRLSLAPAKDAGKLSQKFDRDDPEEARLLDTYLSGLYKELAKNSGRELAIKYKLRRSPDQVLARAKNALRYGTATQVELDHWDNVELEPIAAHSGNVSRVGHGWLGAKINEMKYPEPLLKGCISFLAPDKNGPASDGVRCDTIMFGYYVGDQLKVVKYFSDKRTFNREFETDAEECMVVGAWRSLETTTPVGLMGSIYTSDFDDREEGGASTIEITLVGKDLGFGGPSWVWEAPLWRPGMLFRARYYSHETTTKRAGGSALQTAACVPYLSRNTVLYANFKQTYGGTQTYKSESGSVPDPTYYRFWTNSPFRFIGGLPVMKGPMPRTGNPVWVEMEERNVIPCGDFADAGPWIPGLPADYGWLICPSIENAGDLSGGSGYAPPFEPDFRETVTPGREDALLSISMLDQPGLVHQQPSPSYNTESPVEDYVFYRAATKNVIGSTEYGVVDEADPRFPGRYRFWGNSSLTNHEIIPIFIGVINE